MKCFSCCCLLVCDQYEPGQQVIDRSEWLLWTNRNMRYAKINIPAAHEPQVQVKQPWNRRQVTLETTDAHSRNRGMDFHPSRYGHISRVWGSAHCALWHLSLLLTSSLIKALGSAGWDQPEGCEECVRLAPWETSPPSAVWFTAPTGPWHLTMDLLKWGRWGGE